MQDNYIGDIGDYGKYGLLREICAEAMSLSVNWYRVIPAKLVTSFATEQGKVQAAGHGDESSPLR